jgi:hypothetical protein
MVDKPQDAIVHAIEREEATTLGKRNAYNFEPRDIARTRGTPAPPLLAPGAMGKISG